MAVEINAYSKAATIGKQLSTHFRVAEFACRSGADAVGPQAGNTGRTPC